MVIGTEVDSNPLNQALKIFYGVGLKNMASSVLFMKPNFWPVSIYVFCFNEPERVKNYSDLLLRLKVDIFYGSRFLRGLGN